MIRPYPLKKGDSIGYIAPAGPIKIERLEAAINSLECLGINVILGKSCTLKYGYLAGEDEIRANDINEMFKDKNIKGIFAIRGGYGSARLLDKIDFKAVKRNPKPFFGYSDITMLHIAFNQRCNMITYHSPMPTTELYKGVDKFTYNSLKKAMFSKNITGNIYNPRKSKLEFLVPGKAKGQLIGGNLSIICSSLGTEYEIDTKGKILFIEEIGEDPYKIDRMLMQLIQAGKIKDCSGIVLGYFTQCESSNKIGSLSIEKILQDLLVPLHKPIITNLCCGHQLPTATLPLGAKICFDSQSSSLRVL